MLETVVFPRTPEEAFVVQEIGLEFGFTGTGMGRQTGIAEGQVTITVDRTINAQFCFVAQVTLHLLLEVGVSGKLVAGACPQKNWVPF